MKLSSVGPLQQLSDSGVKACTRSPDLIWHWKTKRGSNALRSPRVNVLGVDSMAPDKRRVSNGPTAGEGIGDLEIRAEIESYCVENGTRDGRRTSRPPSEDRYGWQITLPPFDLFPSGSGNSLNVNVPKRTR